MIFYHGTPIGGSTSDETAAKFLTTRHALVPLNKPINLPVVMEFCQSFILDNSAFSLWKSGKLKTKNEYDAWFDAYFDWCQKIYKHPAFDWCLIPDVIGGSQEDNERLFHKWIRTGTNILGVPVFHLHESLEWLEYLIDNSGRIAIGSSGKWPTPGARGWKIRMDEVMRVCCDDKGRPKCKLHGLRMMNPSIFSVYPFSSVDSTNAAVNSGALDRFGIYPPATRWQRASVIADRIEQYQSAACYKFKGSSR